ncbi:hypothetical protein ACF0H5_001064 [Mactra antiquata]
MTSVAGPIDDKTCAFFNNTFCVKSQKEIFIEEFSEHSDTSDYLSDDSEDSSWSECSSGHEHFKDFIEGSRAVLNEPKTCTLPNPYVKLERCDHLLSLSPGPNFHGIYKIESKSVSPVRSRRPSLLYHSNDFAVFGLDELYDKVPKNNGQSQFNRLHKIPKKKCKKSHTNLEHYKYGPTTSENSKPSSTRKIDIKQFTSCSRYLINHDKFAPTSSCNRKIKNNGYNSGNIEPYYDTFRKKDDCVSYSLPKNKPPRTDHCNFRFKHTERRRKQILNPRNDDLPVLLSHANGDNFTYELLSNNDNKKGNEEKTNDGSEQFRQTLCRVKEEVFDYSGDEQTQGDLNAPYELDNLNSPPEEQSFHLYHKEELKQEVSPPDDCSNVDVEKDCTIPPFLKEREIFNTPLRLENSNTSSEGYSLISYNEIEIKKEPEPLNEDGSDVDVENECVVPHFITDQEIVSHDHTYAYILPELLVIVNGSNQIVNENKEEVCNKKSLPAIACNKEVREYRNCLERKRRSETCMIYKQLRETIGGLDDKTSKVCIINRAVKEIAKLESKSQELQFIIRHLQITKEKLSHYLRREYQRL